MHNHEIHQQILAAEVRLKDRFDQLDTLSLEISEYNQKYLAGKMSNLSGVLELYGNLLFLCLKDSHVDLENCVFVDYGGGTGLYALLAKELGIGTVIYNDIYKVSCNDIGMLSRMLGLELEHIVSGDLNLLLKYLEEHSIPVNIISSYDVIEHVYDVESHFDHLKSVTGDNLRVVYASGANIENPRFVKAVTKTQQHVELDNRDREWGHKDRDSLQSYLEIRKGIIQSYAPELDGESIQQLARETRGLIKQDIEKCVDQYRQIGRISYQIDHPTNTCDPNTGNWSEHLMDLNWLQQVVEEKGFRVQMLVGTYSKSGPILKRVIKLLINAFIRILGRKGMAFSPYYIIYANRDTTTG